MRTTTGAQTGKPRHEWQAGRTAQTPAAGPHHYGGRTHPYMRTSPRSEQSTPHHTCNPCHSHLGTQQESAGCQEQWKETGEGGGRGAKTATGTHVHTGMRVHVPQPTPLAPSGKFPTITPPANTHHPIELRTPCANCRRTWSTPNVNREQRRTNPGDRSHGPQPGSESSHRPYRRRKYQTRRVLR